MSIIRRIRFLAVALVLSLTGIQGNELKNNLDAVLGLGGQMSNIRAMLETYGMLGMNIKFREPDKRLKASILQYETLLDTVEKNFPDKFIQKTVADSRIAWKPVKKALYTALENAGKDSMKDNALYIHANIRSVIKGMVAMKKYLLDKMHVKNASYLNASIEIGASARRLSAHYMIRLWKLNDPTVEKHWNNGVKIYTNSIAILRKSDFAKDAKFKKLLDDCDEKLKYFNMTWSLPDLGTPALIHKKAEKVFEEANIMTKMILKSMLK